MPLRPEDYGFTVTAQPDGGVEIRWRREAFGPVVLVGLGACFLVFGLLALAEAPILLPVLGLAIWLLWRFARQEQTATLGPERLTLKGGSWPWDELDDLAIEQGYAGDRVRKRASLDLLRQQEQAATSWRVVVHRGPKRIVVAGDLGERRAGYLGGLIAERLDATLPG